MRFGKWSPWRSDEDKEGEEAIDRLDEAAEFCRLNDCECRGYPPGTSLAGAMPETVLPATPPVVPTVLPLRPVYPLVVVAAVLMLRVLKLDEERCRREGVGWLGPDIR